MPLDNKNPFADRVGGQQQRQGGGSSAALDVLVTNDQYLIEVDLPGVAIEDIELAIEDGELTIRAHRKRGDVQVAKKDYAFLERRFGEITRTIALPGMSGGVAAKTLADGVLTIAIGRRAVSQELS